MEFLELQNMVSICLDEIIKLKKENELLKENNQRIKETLVVFAESEKSINENLVQVNQMIDGLNTCMNRTFENMKYEILDDRNGQEQLFLPRFYNINDTIEEIIQKKKSLSRFGDSEFALMEGYQRAPYQHIDSYLAERLKNIIQSNEEGLLIAIADDYGNLDHCNLEGKIDIRLYMTEKVRAQNRKYLSCDRVYHNTYITRPYVMYADNNTDAPKQRFNNLKRIWNQRDVIFIEGAQTRLGYGNDLFDNCASIRRIEGPAVNAFDKYDEILQAALKTADSNSLFLIAMGATACVLAHDLYLNGFQALDIGHVDMEYEWFLRGKGIRCEVKNKYNNEFPGGSIVEEINDETFDSQVVCKIL